MDLAERMSSLGTEGAFVVLAKAKELEAQGKEIIHLQIGEPDFDTPQNIVDKAKWALDHGHHHYTPSSGTMDLRKTIADYLKKTRGVQYDPTEIVVGPGGKPIIITAILALLDPGDEVLLPNPTYPAYASFINFVGAKCIPVPVLEEKGFRFDVNDLKNRVTDKTKMIFLNSPSNPTGGFLTMEDYEEIAKVVKKYNLIVFSDEIYSRMIYDGEHASITQIPGMKEHTILMDGFSKTYAMTGWRLGYGAGPKHIIKAMSDLMLNTVSCTASFVQTAGIEALTGPQDEVDKMVAKFKKRRDVFVDGLNKLPGFTCRKPKGAFYVFPNIKGTGVKSSELADHMLNDAGVACLAGTDFGEYGEGYLRFSYANSVENIEKALSWMEKSLKKLPLKVK
ncbi:MAG: pyridoxal phosphate-dependent aminotransferase [Candidatus Eremiobacteraeota bacterium]|nr:pyridoxal phosphate-dependent aminotransferase [Candidatus Eremiobacteraeota bacterium]